MARPEDGFDAWLALDPTADPTAGDTTVDDNVGGADPVADGKSRRTIEERAAVNIAVLILVKQV